MICLAGVLPADGFASAETPTQVSGLLEDIVRGFAEA
jgi:hypothetical protein